MTMLEVDAVDMSNDVSSGSGLKYPAVKVQEDDLKVGDASDWRIDLMAGSSVEESGLSRGVSWDTGYTIVFALEEPTAVDLEWTLISRLRIFVDAEIYVEGSVNGDAVELDEGHSSTKPAGM